MYTLLDMTAGAQKMAVTDPHGFILSLIAVFTVFTALVILYFVYSFIGNLSQPKAKKQTKPGKAGKGPDPETAATIAMALEAELGTATYAAIGLAIHLHLGSSVHDTEPGIITMVPRNSAWGSPVNSFRKTPKK